MSHHHPLDPIQGEVEAADRYFIQLLGRSTPFASRVFREILHHSRHPQAGPGCEQHLHLPSITEVLTIEQCGFPRTYNLNDGMGPELACQVPDPALQDVRLSA
jgi:hypothetical protein